jgi:alpha-L-rhamnosidase
MSTPIDDSVAVCALRCESLDNPLGIDVAAPRLSWQLTSSRRGVMQTAYQVQVSRAESGVIWDSGKVVSDNSTQVIYAGPDLESRRRYAWRARVWDEADIVSAWSESAWWEMGLLHADEWQAQWIEPIQEPATLEPKMPIFQSLGMTSPLPNADYSKLRPSQYLRKTFSAQDGITQARIYATAHGVYRLLLNGVRVGDVELAPEATAYQNYLQYQTYDVTGMIAAGENVLGAVIGDGWYCGRLGLPGESCQYGDKLALLVQLEIEYADGHKQWIVSDADFKSSTAALIYSDLFIGERYDATREPSGWHLPNFDDRSWQPVDIVDYGYANLVAHYGEAVQVVKEIAPVAILTTPKGETVVDLGQNIAGKIRMRVDAPAHSEIVLDFFEVLDANGNALHAIRGRNKDQRDVYVTRGDGVEVYEAWFTFHGFRYVRLSGYPGTPHVEDFTGLVIASDLRDTGTFTCSDARLNRLQENVYWSQLGNLVSLPTDCPQREKAGFTGDAQMFIATACFNMDVAAFFTRWLRNLQIEQTADGQVPVIVPYWRSYAENFAPVHNGSHTSAAWGDGCVIVPWTLYQSYGDVRVLEENYETMSRWLAYVQNEAETGIPERLQGELTPEARERQQYLWNSGFHFGDWLIPSLTAGYNNPFKAAEMTKEVVASCFYAYSTELMAQIAHVLGHEDDHIRYANLNARIREAFAAEYVEADGRLFSHFQGMYVLALKMRMVPAEMRPLLTQQLVDLIAENGYRLDTGFVTMPYLLDVLCDNGRMDIAYRLLFQTECPSWLYEVERGATTIWEAWDAITPAGKVNPSSFNHYAFGCVGDWMVRVIAGLDKLEPGYKRILIHPQPTPELTQARASYRSVYGEIVSSWALRDGIMHVEALIPPNTTATIRLPGAEMQTLDISYPITQDGRGVEVGSGLHHFAYPYSH